MSLKKFYWNKNFECCYTCMYIDEYTLNDSDEGDVPGSYDGMAICCIYDSNKEETTENRLWVSPSWCACPKYKKCTERQADYLDILDVKSKSIIPNPNDISKINED